MRILGFVLGVIFLGVALFIGRFVALFIATQLTANGMVPVYASLLGGVGALAFVVVFMLGMKKLFRPRTQ